MIDEKKDPVEDDDPNEYWATFHDDQKCRVCGSEKVRKLKDFWECKECFTRWPA